MFDIAPTELMVVALVALVVIGPKDLPKAMRFVGHWVGKARGVARQFRSGFDTMVREAELAEMEKKWAEENARIMREHPVEDQAAGSMHPVDAPSPPPPEPFVPQDDADASPPPSDADPSAPVMVERPEVREGPSDQPPAADTKAAS
ncbi:Sec-independent protein translocase protein TatB [Sphingomonas sp. CFBP 13720]|uniref:Sec-independent protein translocase protein TatB n=1 Tax=Sphingomonas sp. CFBP 13720 TaxID=2775302 RepID=UPI0017805AAD|nr:Sec-independent protein translocase protein TatB [Sphingomonas sp. CFBP 13720]MBD8678786.1 twin-arginine translocase subunit TatB [Sphingomonas sp. CFBP 13720]